MTSVPQHIPAGVGVPAQWGAATNPAAVSVPIGLIAARDAAVREMGAERGRCADPRCPCALEPHRFAELPLFVDARGQVWFRGSAGADRRTSHWRIAVHGRGTATAVPVHFAIPLSDVRVLHVPLTLVAANRVHVGNEILLPSTGALAFVQGVPRWDAPGEPVVITTDAGTHRCSQGDGVLLADPQMLGLGDRCRAWEAVARVGN